jgi:prepilin-type N-terminal cleavage/methylation domain-containing protein
MRSRSASGATPTKAARRRGFTLPEVLISLTIAMVVISGAVAFSVQSWSTRRGWTVRETVDRDGRFVGLSLARDVQEAGISFTSTPVFASIDTHGDTVSILSVPYEPTEAGVYPIKNDGDTLPTYPPGGTCGATCIEFQKVSGTYDLRAGDLARLQVGTTRRLLLLNEVTDVGGGLFRVNFLDVDFLANRPSGLDSLLLMRSGTSIQKANLVMYYRDQSSNALMRSQSLNSSGLPIGSVVAGNVEAFEARLLFMRGTEHPTYNGVDADTTNDGNDLIGAKVRAKIRSTKSDPSVNNGVPVARWYEWRVAPRNLLYEKNRM